MGVSIDQLCYGTGPIPPPLQTICLVTHCYAIYRILLQKYGPPAAAAGYSQGEFTAFAAAHVFRFPDALRLIYNLESLLAQDPPSDECMYRFIDIPRNVLETCCKQIDQPGGRLFLSAYISDMQNVVSGKKERMQSLFKQAKLSGARWAIDLKADRAYHCPLCNTTREKATKFFNNIPAYRADFPVYNCLDGACRKNGAILRDNLSKQINHPIHWQTISNNLYANSIQQVIEIGPGCTVSGNTRIANSKLNCKWIGSTEDL